MSTYPDWEPMIDQSKRHLQSPTGCNNEFIRVTGVWVRGYFQMEEPPRGSCVPESPPQYGQSQTKSGRLELSEQLVYNMSVREAPCASGQF